MKLTKELIPPLYFQEKVKDPIVYEASYSKLLLDLYVLEFDSKCTFFSYVEDNYFELSYFNLSELEKIGGPLGLKVEKDIWRML